MLAARIIDVPTHFQSNTVINAPRSPTHASITSYKHILFWKVVSFGWSVKVSHLFVGHVVDPHCAVSDHPARFVPR